MRLPIPPRRAPSALPGVALLLAAALSAACAGAGELADAIPSRDPSSPTSFAVGVRDLTLVDAARAGARGQASRTVLTKVWYPASGDANQTVADAPPAKAGRPFPLVALSHGFLGEPAALSALAEGWARAGFVVVAPTFPFTSRQAVLSRMLAPTDVVNQPGDVSFVLSEMLRLGATPGDPFAGLVDGERMAATGFSLGAITTVGLFNSCCADPRLDAAIVMSGAMAGFSGDYFAAPAKPVLFLHGERDPFVPFTQGQRAYGRARPPKFFVTLLGADHQSPFTGGGEPEAAVVNATTLDFLRWTLKGDASALDRLRKDADVAGVSAFTGEPG